MRILILLIAILILAFSPFMFSAQASSVTVAVKPSSQEVNPGQEFTVSVYVDPGSKGVSGGEINLSFAPHVMEALDMKPGSLLGSDPITGFKQIDNEAGFLRYALARTGATIVATQPGSFALVTFKVLDEVESGTYALTLERIGLADESFTDISEITLDQASVSVVATALPPSTPSEAQKAATTLMPKPTETPRSPPTPPPTIPLEAIYGMVAAVITIGAILVHLRKRTYPRQP